MWGACDGSAREGGLGGVGEQTRGDSGKTIGLLACGWPHRSVLAGTSVPLAIQRRT